MDCVEMEAPAARSKGRGKAECARLDRCGKEVGTERNLEAMREIHSGLLSSRCVDVMGAEKAEKQDRTRPLEAGKVISEAGRDEGDDEFDN